jgi:antirestriction protein ArdC
MVYTDKEKVDLKQDLTNKIISAMEGGTAPWQKEWDAKHLVGNPNAHNFVTKKRYKGVNCLLTFDPVVMELGDGAFGSFKQITDKGFKIEKGSKSFPVFYYDVIKINDKETGEEKEIPLLKRYAVFHSSQIIDFPPPNPSAKIVNNEFEALEAVEIIMKNSGLQIEHKGAKAFYNVSCDKIILPPKTTFNDAISLAKTQLHELAHATGSESRLNRKFGKFGDEEYAREELRAELASAFIGIELGISGRIDNHISYVASWSKILKSDKNEIFKACSDAQKITDLILSFHPEFKAKLDNEKNLSATQSEVKQKSGFDNSGIASHLKNDNIKNNDNNKTRNYKPAM